MKHRSITVDALYGGTGIREQFEGFIDLLEIPISQKLRSQISKWVQDYPSDGKGIMAEVLNVASDHDIKGISIRRQVATELGPEYKIRYFSDIMAKELIEISGGRIIET